MLVVEWHYRDSQTSANRGLYFSPAHALHMIEYIENYLIHSFDQKDGVRRLKKLDHVEVSLVTFPGERRIAR